MYHDIDWQKEPESTTDHNEHGFLHYKGLYNEKVIFEVRFDYKNGIDIWALMYLPTGRVWTRDGINEDKTLKHLAELFLNREIFK